MNVLDLSVAAGWLNDVAIVAAASLPEPVMHISIRLPVFHPRKKRRSMALNMNEGLLGYGLFDRIEDLANVISWLGWPNEQMCMFGHDDISPNMKVMFIASTIDRVH